MNDVTTRTIEVHGAETSYLEAGDPSSPTLVLLHDGAYGSDATSCFGGIIPSFAETHHVLAPDLLGHGGTAKVFRYDMDPMTQRLWHLAGFCAAVGIEQADFVGSSFGGGMILHAAVRRNLPMRAGVSICGPGGIFMIGERFAALQNYEPSLEAAREIAELMERSPDDAAVARRYEATLAPGHWEALSAVRVKNPAHEGEGFDWRPKFQEALGGVDTPLLLIAGEQDVLLEEDWERSMADIIPGAQAVEIADARHIPHLDHPDAVVTAITDFLGQR